MKISIIIPAYNEEKYIGRILESIKRLDINDWQVEVIVVDAESTDKTSPIAKSYGAKVIRVPHRGIGFARQQGFLKAQGEIVAYTDADAILPVDWLRKHVEALSQLGVVCSFGTYRVSDSGILFSIAINLIWPLIVSLSYHLFHQTLSTGQNIFAKRKEALKIGGFDTSLELFEDADFTDRMKSVGKVVFLPDCIVYASGRRSKEGWQLIPRAITTTLAFLLFGKRTFKRFSAIR